MPIYLTTLLNGLVIGFAYVVPIGTQNLFMINSALSRTRKMALLTAGIIIFFDISLAVACFLGIGALMEVLPVLKGIILGVGILALLYIGVSLVRTKETKITEETVDTPILKIIASAFVVTWLNPQAIIDGTLFLGSFRATLGWGLGWFFLLGVVLASFLWFSSVTLFLSIFKKRITGKIFRWVNIVCGLVIIAYSIKLVIDFLKLIGWAN